MRKIKCKYDELAIKEIHIWKSPDIGWLGKQMESLSWRIDKVGNLLMDNMVGNIINKSIKGIVSVSNDLAQWTVRPGAIFKEFRDAGHNHISDITHVQSLQLKEVDKVIGWLGAKYKGVALMEGASTGAAGLPGIPIDIVSLITLNFRAIGEFATYCGFDISTQHERLFVMNILALASSPSDASKELALAQLVRIAKDVAKRKAWRDLENHAFVVIIQNIAKALGIRLTKAKLAQFIPIFGGVVGAGFNVYYTSRVCDAAYFLYRERFLARKYGDWVIETTTQPATDFDPKYPEEKEKVPLPRKRRTIRAKADEEVIVEKTGVHKNIAKAVKKLKATRKTKKVLKVPQNELRKAVQIMKEAGVSGTVTNLTGTKKRFIRAKG